VLAAEIARIGAQYFSAFEPAAIFVRPEVGALHETPEPRSEVLTVAFVCSPTASRAASTSCSPRGYFFRRQCCAVMTAR
jgi:hypothetical protein